ncbi:hypothetical protein GCM10027577_03140 [Spirosoma fluminis]
MVIQIPFASNRLVALQQEHKTGYTDEQNQNGSQLLVQSAEYPYRSDAADEPDKSPKGKLIVFTLGGLLGLNKLLMTLLKKGFEGHKLV